MAVTQMLLVGACCLLAKEALAMPASNTHKDSAQQDTADAEKRSQEDIMFGNQQNKPAGMVDDLIVFPERKSSSSAQTAKDNALDKNSTKKEEKKGGVTAPTEDVAAPAKQGSSSTLEQLGDGEQEKAYASQQKYDYYDYLDDSPSADGREASPPTENSGDIDYSLYDYSDSVFRRKRNLRNSLDELLRNRRMPRRALRYKRDANMDDLLYFLTQVAKSEPYSYFSDEEIPTASRITLNPQVQPSPLEQYLSELGAMSAEERARALVTLAALADQGQLQQSARTQEEESPDVLPEWFQVSRRSPRSFYPQDYRYLVLPSAGQKRATVDRWGRVLKQRRQQRADDEANVNRLYALAGLMAEPEQDDVWREA